jgi:hypothetical protein
MKSQTLEKNLVSLENDYKTLYDSFLAYQKEAEKQIRAEKAKAKTASIIAWITGISSVIFCTLWGIEHFLIK